MTYPRKFFLNLASNSISLVVEQDQEQKVLDSFDPNEPAANEQLKKLFHLAKALNYYTPEIEINLPENLLNNETLITNNPISQKEAICLINKRKENNKNGIISLNTENIGTRATSITYIQASLINEVKEFVEKAGFSIKKFNIGKFSFEKNRNIKLNYQTYLKPIKLLKLKRLSRPFYSSLALVIVGLSIFLYKNEEKVTYQIPSVKTNLYINKIEPNTINQNNKLDVRNNLFASTKISSKEKIFREINTLYTPLVLDRFNSFFMTDNIHDDITLEYNLNNSKDILFQNDISYKKLKAEILKTSEIKRINNFNLFRISSLENMIDYESLFKILSVKSNYITKNGDKPDFRKIISYYEPEIINLNTQFNKDLKQKLDEKIINSTKEKNKAVKQPDKKQETFPEFDPLLIEYAIKISPYKKPSIIDSIRILSEPTLSSGAIIFVKIPKERPSYFKALKIIKPSQVKITAKATKSPSIPEKASVGYNSTKRNFIDLDRTNLIGIVGKSSNPSALLRLSNGKIIRLKVGQWFEGWRVFAIDRDKIHVENGFKQEILRMPG